MHGLKLGDCVLDRQQVEAVVACEDAQLVLASAGSGKTMSLLAKLEYLVLKLHIRPERILVISFTKKTVEELIDRCAISGVEIRTFHSIGLNILRQSGEKCELISDTELNDFWRSTLMDPCTEIVPDLDGLIALVRSFILLYKNSGKNLQDISEQLMSNKDKKQLSRAKHFLGIINDVLPKYNNFLRSQNKIDFSDMINLATESVESGRVKMNYKYILLDEVQDLSPNRQRLIRAILDNSADCRLFAVGDDWQSIYRFAGSDLDLIRNFETFFNRKTKRSLIETTHRFGKPTTKISSDFIERNRLQVRKNVRASMHMRTPISVILSKDASSDVDALDRIIEILGAEYLSQKSVQIVSRYNHDIERLKSSHINITPLSNQTYDINWRNTLHFEFCSMHKSKGITRDIVIVLNMSSRATGMPATKPLDPLIDVLLAPEEDFAYAEERRLFYVAITRAREQTFLIADAKHPSIFILEINDELGEIYRK